MSVARRWHASYTFPSQGKKKRKIEEKKKILDHGIMNISHGRGHLWRDECQTECRSSEAAFSNCPSDKMPQPASVTDVNRRNTKRRGSNTGTRGVYVCDCMCVCVYGIWCTIRRKNKSNFLINLIEHENALSKRIK